MNWLTHLQPHDAGTEQTLVEDLLATPSLMRECYLRIEHGDFHYTFYGGLFRAVEQLWLAGRAVDAVGVAERMLADGFVDDFLEVSLSDRISATFRRGSQRPPDDQTDIRASYLREYALQRRLTDFAHSILFETYRKSSVGDPGLRLAADGLREITDWYEALKPRRERFDRLRSMPYAEYLRSPEWKARRDAQVAADGNACRVCGSGDSLNVHHRTYARRGFEAPGDLITFCQPCHQLFHDNGKLAKAED